MIQEETPWLEPISAFSHFLGKPYAHLLHAGKKTVDAQWSIIVAQPSARFEVRNGVAFLNDMTLDGDALACFEKVLAERTRVAPVRDVPFATGAVGFFGYAIGGLIEPSLSCLESPFPFPDMAFGVYDGAWLFDRKNRRSFWISHNRNAAETFEMFRKASKSVSVTGGRVKAVELQSNFQALCYQEAVNQVIESILRGDIFQANIAQHLKARLDEGEPYDVFRRLSGESAAPFGAFLQFREGALISNSPERFFKIDSNRRINVEPIKGTRPRGATAMEDEVLAQALLNDGKDRAENIMITDLMRNDLSRICHDRSISEDAICHLESYPTVHHLVSRISGGLKNGVEVIDVIRALFPCGSITGAPKIEAMRTISKIEKIGRGPYCGAHGFIDDSGRADFSVSIRTMMAYNVAEEKHLVFPVGGGVTARSNARAEYDETLTKARSFLIALGIECDSLL